MRKKTVVIIMLIQKAVTNPSGCGASAATIARREVTVSQRSKGKASV